MAVKFEELRKIRWVVMAAPSHPTGSGEVEFISLKLLALGFGGRGINPLSIVHRQLSIILVPRAGLEPARPVRSTDFKSAASTSSATPARGEKDNMPGNRAPTAPTLDRVASCRLTHGDPNWPSKFLAQPVSRNNPLSPGAYPPRRQLARAPGVRASRLRSRYSRSRLLGSSFP